MFESRDTSSSAEAYYPRLLGDIGGTNARFGWQATEGGEITHVQVLACAEFESLLSVINTYLQAQQLPRPACASLGIANPVVGDQVAMTNHHWQFSIHTLRIELGLSKLLVLNDFTALALALTSLSMDSKRQIGGGTANPDAAIGLIGPGTGLGVSGLLPIGYQNKWIPIAGEGGHISLGASNALEFAILERLQKRYGHVSAERILSGSGLVDLYHALCDVYGKPGRELTTAADVLDRAEKVPASTASETIETFCGFLGTVAGDLALTLGARGGIYIGGGIVPRLGARFEASPFRERFEAKGRFKSYLQAIPAWVIHSPVSPALLGASKALTLHQW